MSDERFARQYRFGPPPRFPLASSCTSIVHHLSGPNIHAQARSVHPKDHKLLIMSQKCIIQSISLRTRVYNSKTRTYVRLLGPCFKTGRITTPWWRLDAETNAAGTISQDCHILRTIKENGTQLRTRNSNQTSTKRKRGEDTYRYEINTVTIRRYTSKVCYSLSPNDFTYFSHSFQIPFHLSLTVLVRYRSQSNI